MYKLHNHFLTTVCLVFFSAVTSAAPLWQSYAAYQTEDVVTFEGRDYKALQSHITNPTWVPSRSPSLWLDIGAATAVTSNNITPTLGGQNQARVAAESVATREIAVPEIRESTIVPSYTSAISAAKDEEAEKTTLSVVRSSTTFTNSNNVVAQIAEASSIPASTSNVQIIQKCAAPWASNVLYAAGVVISFGGNNYQAKSQNADKNPKRVSTNIFSTKYWKKRKDYKNWNNQGPCSNSAPSVSPDTSTKPTITPTAKPTNIPTPTVSIKPTSSPTPTLNPSNTPAPAITPTPIITLTPAPTSTPAPTVSPTPTNIPINVASSSRILDLAQSLIAGNFSLADADFSPSAVVLKDNILYVANDINAASVLRFDLGRQTALSPISSFSIQGSTETFKRMGDISQFGNKLYTASLSSNRVDVFDLSQGEPQFITTLGTGNWTGPSNLILVHPLAVAANADYVFAADTQQRISVWKQSDVIAVNRKTAIKHAYLSLPGCSDIYCEIKLETAGDRLYASFGNGNTLVYDVSQLAESTTMVQPIMQQTNVGSALAKGDDGALYVGRTRGGIDRFALNDLPISGGQILPSQPLDQFRQITLPNPVTTQNLIEAKDIVFSQQRIAAIQSRKIVIMPQRQVDELHVNDPANPQYYQYAAIPLQQKELILQDGESWETLTNPQLRGFKINRVLSGQFNQRQLMLSSYSAIPVSNLELHASLKGTGQWFVLAYLDQLPAFSTVKFDVPVMDGQAYQRIDNNGSVKFYGLDAFKHLPSDMFDVRIASKTDAHVQKISNFKMKWQLSFGKYDAGGGDASWGQINPIYAREWVIMMTNFAYALNSPEFEHVWFNHKKVMGYDFFGNAGQVNGPGGFFTDDDYRNVYQAIMNRGGIRLGVTTMGGGLGGGDVLGIDTWNFYQHYFRNNGIIGHEFGHHWGSHDSGWANEAYGLQSSSAQLLDYFLRKQQLPYMDPNTNGFHLAPREMLYNGIDKNMRVPRPSSEVNTLERYFSTNPL